MTGPASAGGRAAPRESAVFSFRAPYSDGATRLGLYGDMGVYNWNCMENLQSDVQAGEIDAIVHAGDHCYNQGDDDEHRGDGYMEAFEPVLSSVPWVPIVGNMHASAPRGPSRCSSRLSTSISNC